MKALSERNDDPQTASRPFDIDRNGLLWGKVVEQFIFEEYEHAKARGAKNLCRVIGDGATGDVTILLHHTQMVKEQ